MDGHLFAFEVGGDADEGEDDVGVLCGLDGFVAESLGGGAPFERDGCAEQRRFEDVFDADVMRMGIG